MSVRDPLVDLASRIVRQSKRLLTQGEELVVVVTDRNGDWVAVSATVHNERVEQILDAALQGQGKELHPNANIIDAEAE